MKESKGIYVTDSQIRLNVRKEYRQQYQPYTRRECRDPYTLTNDVGVQFDTRKMELECYRNYVRVAKYDQKRYGAPRCRAAAAWGAWGVRRSRLDVGVGSVKALPRRRVRKVYAPAPRVVTTGVGSGDLASLINLSLRPRNRYRPRTRESRESRGGAGVWRGRDARGGWGGGGGAGRELYRVIRTSSKCVGGPRASAVVLSVSAKLSPILQTRSGTTSPIANQHDSKDSRGTETDQAEAAEGSVGTPHGSVGSKNQMSSMMKNQNQKQNRLSYMPTTKRKNKMKDNSSDSLLQKVHEFEELANEEEKLDDALENELEREYRKIFEPPEHDPKLTKKSTSLFKRKFSALRKSVTKKESPAAVEPPEVIEAVETVETVAAPSMRDASVTSDPPSLESRSFTSDRSGNRRKRSHFAYKHSSHRKASRNWSRTPMGVDSEYSQGVKGMFKLWGKKFNFEEPASRKDAPDSPELKSTNDLSKTSFEQMEGKPTDRGEPLPVKEIQETIGDAPSIESKQGKSKNKRFFFFRKKPSKDTKSPAVSAPAYKKEPVTTHRCEVTEGLNIQMQPQTPHPHQNPNPNPPPKKSVHKNKSNKSIANYEEMLKAAWLVKYLTAPIESRKSVKVRWNNGMYYASSSSTVFELMEDLYKGNRLVLSHSEYTSNPSTISSKYNNSRGQFLQAFHAYMMPRMIHNNRIKPPNKSSNNIITLSRNKPDDSEVEMTISDQKWYIEKSKAFSNKIEVVLHKLQSQNLVKLREETEASCLKINMPKDFFGERMSEIPLRLTSEEEVYKIVEYESDGPCERHIPLIIKSDVSDSGDYKTEDTRMEKYKTTTIETLRVAISIQNDGKWDGRARDTIIKRPPVYRDVLTQGSHVYVPRCRDGVGVGTLDRHSNDSVQDAPLSLLFLEYSGEESHQKKKTKDICEFAKSFLRSDYQRWVPSSLALFASHASDSHATCYQDFSCLCTPPLLPSRSCPNLPEDYYFNFGFSTLSCSTADKDRRQSMYKCPGSYNKANQNSRLLPKDSCKLFKTRICRTLVGEKMPVIDRPYSVPSETSTGMQAHPCGSKWAGIVSFICEEECDPNAEPHSPSGDNDFHTSASGIKFCKESSISSSNYIETALKTNGKTENTENFIRRCSMPLSSAKNSEVTMDQPMASSILQTPGPSSAFDSRVCSAKPESVSINELSRSRSELSTLIAVDHTPGNSASFQEKKKSLESVTKTSSDEPPAYVMIVDDEEKKSKKKVHKPNLLQRWISPLMRSRHSVKQFTAKEQPSNVDVELVIASSAGSGSPGDSCNCTPGSSSSSEDPGRSTDLNTNGDDTLTQFNEVFLSEMKSCEGAMIGKTTDNSVLNEGIKISVEKKTTDIYKREPKKEKQIDGCVPNEMEPEEPQEGPVDDCDCSIGPRNNEPLTSTLSIKPRCQRPVGSPEPPGPPCPPKPQGPSQPPCPPKPQGPSQPPCPSKPQGPSQPPCPPKPQGPSQPPCPPKPQGPSQPPRPPKPLGPSQPPCLPKSPGLSQPPCPPTPQGPSEHPCPPKPPGVSQPPCPSKPPNTNSLLNKKDCDDCVCLPGTETSSSSSSMPKSILKKRGKSPKKEKEKVVTLDSSSTTDLELDTRKPGETSASNQSLFGDSIEGDNQHIDKCPEADKKPKNKPLKIIPKHACTPRNIGCSPKTACPAPETSDQHKQTVDTKKPPECLPDVPHPMSKPYTCVTCSSGFDTNNYQSSRDPPQYDGDTPANPVDADYAFDDSCRVALSQVKAEDPDFEYGDSLISVETYNYLNGLTETAPLINNLYKNSKVHVPTNVRKKQENVDSNSDASSSNVIEINVNFKLNKTTEIKIDKEIESKITKTNETKTNKSVENLTNNVFMVNNRGQRKNHLKETEPDDLNIRILIKNQKAGKKGKSKKAIEDAHAVTLKKYSNASTEHRAALQDANVDAHFSIQRVTVGVMQSFNQAHLVRCDKALSSAVILMCSKSLLAIRSSVLKGTSGAGTSPNSSLNALYCKSFPARPMDKASDTIADPSGTSGSHSIHLTRSTPTIGVSVGQASSAQRSILIKYSKSEKSTDSDKCSKSDFTTTEKTSKGGYDDDENAPALKKKIHKSTKRISFTDTELSVNPELSFRTTTTFKTTDEPFTDSKNSDDTSTHITSKVGDGSASDALEKTSDDDESVILEEIPSAEVTAKTLKEEKKEMLKQVFEDGLYLKKPKNERRIQKMKDLLKAILTDDSDSEPLAVHDSCCVNHNYKRSDSMNNLYREFNAVVPRSSRENADDDSESARSITVPNKSKCYCKQFSTKLKLKGKGCCCVKTVEKSDKDVTCTMSSLYAFNGMDGMSYWIPSVECVHVQTANSRYEGSSQEPLPPAGNNELLVNKSADINLQDEQTDELTDEQVQEQMEERESYSSKKFIKEVTHVDVPDSHISGLNDQRSSRRDSMKTRFSGSGGADVLQMYETKKAVLEIYAEKTISDQGEHFVAKLPKFVHSAEGCLYKNVVWNRVFGSEIFS